MTRREFLKAVAGTAFFFTAKRLFPVNRDGSLKGDDRDNRQHPVDLALAKSKDYVKGVEGNRLSL